MGDSSFSGSVTAVLDAVLVPAGFQAGQGMDDEVIYCAARDEFSARHPSLPQAGAQTAGCVDLVIDANDDDSLYRLDLEGISLRRTLATVGQDDDAAAVDQLLGAPLDDALPRLAEILSRLFGVRPR